MDNVSSSTASSEVSCSLPKVGEIVKVRHWLHGLIEAEVLSYTPSGHVDLKGVGSWDWTVVRVSPDAIIS